MALNIYKSLTQPSCRGKIDKNATEHLAVGKELRDILREQVQKQQSDEEEKCLQSFRLTTAEKDITYEWYKNRVDDRLDGTCEWFLTHPRFEEWLGRESGVLLVTADPGCGKSVLAKHLVDDVLPRSETICYFFFKDNDQNTVRQALCAILHQLFSQRRSLIRHAIAEYKKEGDHLKNSTALLWSILEAAGKGVEAGPVVILLDALDECAESDFGELIQGLNKHIGGKVKVLATSRPYDQILSKFRGPLNKFPPIRIPGEKEDKVISQEVNHVIRYRVGQLATEKELSQDIKDQLERRLLENQHRTYLWVYLVFEHLKKKNFQKTTKSIMETISRLPESVNEAYEKILTKSSDDGKLGKALKLILAASRPLTLTEMNIAINTNCSTRTEEDFNLSPPEDFELYIRELCGLFISIYNGGVYFLHQTAREFLLADTLIAPKLKAWQHSITLLDAHTIFAKVCVAYLKLFNSDAILPGTRERGLLDYSAGNWATHFREAHIKTENMVSAAVNICEPNLKCYLTWFPLFWQTTGWVSTSFAPLLVAVYSGLESVAMMLLLEKNADIETKDTGHGRTPLSWAAGNGHAAVVKLLLEKNAEIEAKDRGNGQTPLSWAAGNGHAAVVQLLLEKNADIETKDRGNRQTPLTWAARNGHAAVVKLLLERNADIETKGRYDRTPLSWAAENGHAAVVQLLLEKYADIETKSRYDGRTPLGRAAWNGHAAVVQLLLEKNADIETKGRYDRTPLSWAAENGHATVVQVLLENNADIETKGRYDGRTPLGRAAGNGHAAVVQLLLEKNADIETKDTEYGQTPLTRAAENGHAAVVQLLLERNAGIETKDRGNGQTPLSWAAGNGHATVVQLLLERNADIEMKDSHGRTPLRRAAENGHEAVVKLLETDAQCRDP